MKLKLGVVLLSLLGTLSISAHASWVKYGHWMLNDDLSVTGEGFWDRTIMFDMLNGSLRNRDDMRNEIAELATMAGVNYRSMTTLLNKLEGIAQKQSITELQRFSNQTNQQRLENYFHYDKYMLDSSAAQVFMFSHKMNQSIQGMVMLGYRNLDDLLVAKLDGERYVKSCDNDRRYSSRDCGILTSDRFTKNQISKINASLKNAYGVSLKDAANVLYLYDNQGHDLYVVHYQLGREAQAKLFKVNTKTYQTSKSVAIKELTNI